MDPVPIAHPPQNGKDKIKKPHKAPILLALTFDVQVLDLEIDLGQWFVVPKLANIRYIDDNSTDFVGAISYLASQNSTRYL